MTRLFSTLSSLGLVLAVSLAVVGCRDSSTGDGNGSQAAPANSQPTTQPQSPPGNGGTPAASPGIVGQLTGDPDSQVDPNLQNLVGQALALGDADAPLEGF